MKDSTFDASKMRQLRKAKKLSQKELAQLAGVSFSALRAYENERYTPKIDAIERICNALGVPLDVLYGRNIQTFETPLDFEIAWIRSGGGAHLGSELGRKAVMIVSFEDLNEAGQRRALDLLEILSKVPEYKRGEPSPDQRLNIQKLLDNDL